MSNLTHESVSMTVLRFQTRNEFTSLLRSFSGLDVPFSSGIGHLTGIITGHGLSIRVIGN